MELIDRAIESMVARLKTAQYHLTNSNGDKNTIYKKQKQVEVNKFILSVLLKEKFNDSDFIRGRRLTNVESMNLMCPDIPYISDDIFNEVLEPFIENKEENKNHTPNKSM